MLFTSGDWKVDVSKVNKDRFTTHGIYEFMCEKFNQLIDATIEINQVDLTSENSFGFCQVDEDGEFLIHIHNDLSYGDYVTTLIHELVHVKQTLQGLKDDEMRESEAYFWERLLSKEFNDSSLSGTPISQVSA
jgi:Zn-dependent peptidase ImmA (M78 family)